MDRLECRCLLSTEYVSDLPFASETNGWGPVERDQDTGGAGLNDGNPLVVNGVTYAKGLGVHAPSEVVLNLGGNRSRFASSVGIVDTHGTGGSVVFQVFADGDKVYDSGLMTGLDDARAVDVAVGGVQQLRLVVTVGPDNFAYDHAAWADARLITDEQPQPGPPQAPTDLAVVAHASVVRLTWQDPSNTETGFRVERSTNGSAFATIATLNGINRRSYDDAGVMPSTNYTYRVVATNADGDSLPSAAASITTPPPGNFLSDLPFVSSNNAWGPVERDQDTGGSGANDGYSLVVGGVSYAKGLGMHAPAEVVFDLDGDYARFTSAVGISDTWGNGGSVVFQVFADGAVVYDSGVVTGVDAARLVDVNVAGVQELRLVVSPTADGWSYDHAVWADARIVTPPPLPGAPSAPPGLVAVSLSDSLVTLNWGNTTNEVGFRVERSTSGSLFQTVAMLPVNRRQFDDTAVSPLTAYAYRVVAFNADGEASSSAVPVTTLAPTHFLSDLPFASSTNGWGPVERDMDTGGAGPNDGIPLSLNGVQYAKGLGVHAPAEVVFNTDGGYTRLLADVGIIDRYGDAGSVVFQVFIDGTKVYESPLLTGASATVPVDIDIEGANQLKLVVTTGPDGFAYDHAAWAGARVVAAGPPAAAPPNVPTLVIATAVSDETINLTWRDRANNESSFKVERSTNGGEFVQVATLPANTRAFSDTLLHPSTSYTYRIRAANQYGDSLPAAAAATTLPHSAFVSDLAFASSTNGWGPVERDQDTGGLAANDGVPIVIGGVPFARGLGVHAPSDVALDLDGKFVRFVSSVGIVDTYGNAGTVVFRVFADGAMVYDSGVVTGSDAARTVDVDVTGVKELRLVAAPTADGLAYDHAAWGGARVLYAPETTATPRAPSNLRAAASSPTDVHLTWNDDSAIEEGYKVERTTDGITFTQIAVLGRSARGYHDLSVQALHPYAYRVRAYNGAGDSAYAPTVGVTTPPNPQDIVYLSDLPFASTVNGLGPVERNRSNGGAAAGDGGPLVLNGVTYAKGLGVAGYSEVTFDLGGDYARFQSDVGVDDVIWGHNAAMMIFRVFGDGVKLYDSGTMASDTNTKSVDISVVGINELKLVVIDGGDGVNNDLGDWAGARLVLASPGVPLYPATPLSALATASGHVELNWSDTATNELGFHVQRSTNGVDFETIATVAPNVTTYVDPTAVPRLKYIYRIAAFNSTGSSPPSFGAFAVTGVTYLSDLPFVSATSGYGPVERDMDTGEHDENDGTIITLEGVTYSKGLGHHPMAEETDPPAEIVFDLGGQYTRFQSDVGIDDRYGIPGSGVFKVYADGVLIFTSSVLTGLTPHQSIDLDITGVQELKLVVTNAGDGFWDDHTVWAGARVY